ncbi:hypothetical protein PsorP6_008219 [Peronosclerospora sorghi]|uniref:Uncharacterized protein n=1 Tax=Peronosclerospora sorghi TaxID=230839 RepID=A0ACC0W989_9STRA|nr:hypothetical protein PsorP6_008219 [Peronosclerospora sorghi]
MFAMSYPSIYEIADILFNEDECIELLIEKEDRIVPIPGNLAQTLLGLPRDTFKVLATEIDAIVHNAADVYLVEPYAALKSVNVLGTHEVLRLAVTNGFAKTRVKPVHYISTGAVFPSTYSAPKFMEVADLSKVSDQLDNGYAKSKWVSEQMCHETAQRGLPVSSLRPDRSDWFFDMTPVDYAARAIVHFAASRPVEALCQTLHIQKPSLPVKSDVFSRTLLLQ